MYHYYSSGSINEHLEGIKLSGGSEFQISVFPSPLFFLVFFLFQYFLHRKLK